MKLNSNVHNLSNTVDYTGGKVLLNKLKAKVRDYLDWELTGNLLQVKLFSVTSVLQDKNLKEKTVVVHIRNLTKVVTLPLNVTVMSHTLLDHSA